LIGVVVYSLCALTSGACAVLLTRSYLRTRVPLLAWASLCFVFLFANNFLLLIDLAILPQVDLSLARAVTGTIGTAALLFGILQSD
jgi:hypothetical protein